MYVRNRGVRGSKRGVPNNRRPLFRGRVPGLLLKLFGSANQVNQAGAAGIKDFSQSRPLHQSAPLIGGNTASPGCRKDPLPAVEGCVTGTNGRAGSERQAPREWGLAFWSRLAVLCHHTAEMASPNGLPLRQAAGAGEGKKRRLLCEWPRSRIVKLNGGGLLMRVFMHGRERPAVTPPPWLLQAQPDGSGAEALQGCR